MQYNNIEKQQQLVESPDYKTSCISTLKSFLGFHQFDTMDSQNNTDVKPITMFTKFNSSSRLSKLRKLMKSNNITTYIIPSEDEHQSEYTAIKDQRREYISGFTGSAGIAIVTLHSAALSTDSRYFLQADEQLDSNWVLLKQGVQGYPTWIEWMIEETVYQMDQLKESGDIAVDPRLISWKLGESLISKCHENNVRFVNDLEYNLIDLIRGKITDNLNHDLILYSIKYSGLNTIEKLTNLRNEMENDGCFVYISNMLDSIAWLLNLRGNDVIYNPVFFCYTIVYLDEIVIYIDKKKLKKEVLNYLTTLRVTIKSYNQIWDDLPAISNSTATNKKFNKICLELNCNYSIYINIPPTFDIKFRSILTELKGIKNKVEIENLKKSQLIDSVALVRFFNWIEHNASDKLTELDVVDKSYEFRKNSEKFKGLSFATIAASGANAAIVHYEPTNENFSNLEMNNVLLLDSGGQYFEGTTDITRTIYLNGGKPPTKELKKSYTLVLKGHLNVAMLKFKFGTSSYYIDSLARKPLREYGLDYGHGTGHGIDNYICVHSGPCGLSPSKTSYNYKPLENGNFISDEPGYYKSGEYGIRIESDVLVVNGDEDEDDMLEFDYLTLVPFCKELIDVEILNDEQIKWINEYHKVVYDALLPKLENVKDFEAIEWLRNATSAIYA